MPHLMLDNKSGTVNMGQLINLDRHSLHGPTAKHLEVYMGQHLYIKTGTVYMGQQLYIMTGTVYMGQQLDI